ncbi:MAG: hypothetical protein ACI4MF_13870, partial [Candidatus Faecivicinus sp.]
MKKTMRCALLLALLAALCLSLSGCEDEDARVRQALIDMGYMNPTPEPDATPEPSETPEADVPSESQQTPEPDNPSAPNGLPLPGEWPESVEIPGPGGQSDSEQTADSTAAPDPTTEAGNFPDLGRIFENIATPAPINPPDLGKLFDSGWGLSDKQSVESGAEAAVESAVPD